MIVLIVISGIAFGAQPLLVFNYGAHNTKRLKEIIKFHLFLEITFATAVDKTLASVLGYVTSFFSYKFCIISSV